MLWKEGYRPFFLLFPAWGVTLLALWVASLLGRPAIGFADHAVAMIWGVLGSAILGFLLTAYPRQNGAPPPARRTLIGFFSAQIAVQVALGASWAG